MGHPSLTCKRCGCELAPEDLRQMAVYYRTENASVLAVQYDCPHCGANEWQHCPSTEWPALLAEAEAAVAEASAETATPEPERAPVVRLTGAPLTLDDYIDFCLRLEHLDSADLAELRAPS